MQWQVRTYYANGAVFVCGIEASGLAQALEKADVVGPGGSAWVVVTPIPPKGDRKTQA